MKLLNPQLLKANIETRMQSDMEDDIISGAAVLVRQNGQIIYENYFGATAPGGDQPVTADTIFRLASMTKPITGAAILLLLARGQIELEDPVSKYLPAYGDMRLAALRDAGVLADAAAGETDAGTSQTGPTIVDAGPVSVPITIRHLLTHTSGIGSAEVGMEQHARMTAEDNRTLENAVNYFAGQGLAFKPFTAQAYSGLAAFDVLARIVEIVSGKDYNAFLEEEIFGPCGMKDTTFLPSDEQWNRVITMHNRIDGHSCAGETFENCIFGDIPCTHYLGGAGLVSTARDYSHFAEMLLNRGACEDTQILPPELVDLMATPHVPASIMPGHERWGLSVRVITGEEYPTLPVSAFGWSGAFGTHFWVDPVNNITAVYMKNSHYDGGSGAVTAFHFEEDVYHSF